MKRKRTIIAAVILLLVVAVGGAIAYFTDSDEKTNTFTIGNVDISLTETAWSSTDSDSNGVPDAAENLMPGQSVPKNPVINNLSTKNSAFVFAKVVVPCTTETTPQEFFTYSVNTDKWTELSSAAVACTNGNATHVYYYGTSGTLTELAKATDSEHPTATDKAVFDNVTLLGTLKGNEGVTGNKDIVVTGYGIQADGLTSETPADVWGYIVNNN